MIQKARPSTFILATVLALAPALPLAAPATPLAPAQLGEAQARLGFRLIDQMRRDGKTNVVVSPASLAGVLALLDLGANAEMRAALARTLGFENGADAAAQLAALRVVAAPASEEGGPLAVANAMVLDPRAAPYPRMLAGLGRLGARVSVERLDDPATIARVNAWVADHTRGRIPGIIDKAPDDGGLLALNALYFKDRWKQTFDPALTQPARFRGVGGLTREVAMMRLPEVRLRLRRQGAFVAVELPYATDRFRLVLVTTSDHPASSAEFRTVAGWLAGEGFSEHAGELSLPSLALGGNADLLPALDALGLARGRASPGALAGFSPAPLVIAQVLQRTQLRLDEAGTEAAATTAVTTTRSSPGEFVKVVVDKPFLFALRDAQTGLLVLAGYVGDPVAEERG